MLSFYESPNKAFYLSESRRTAMKHTAHYFEMILIITEAAPSSGCSISRWKQNVYYHLTLEMLFGSSHCYVTENKQDTSDQMAICGSKSSLCTIKSPIQSGSSSAPIILRSPKLIIAIVVTLLFCHNKLTWPSPSLLYRQCETS